MSEGTVVRVVPCPRCGEHRDVHQTDSTGQGSTTWGCYKCGHTWRHDPGETVARKSPDGKS